jgi:hypothetical protein
MSRDLSAGALSEIGATELQPILLFEAEFSSGTTYVWNGIGDLSWDSQTWTGVGSFLQFSEIEETTEVKAAGASVSLSGIPASLVTIALDDVRQNKPGKLYLAFLSNNEVVADPYLVFSGRLDVVHIDESAETSTITLQYESRLIDLTRPRVFRYTPEDQSREFSGDLGMQYVPSLQDKKVNWGRAGDAVPSQSSAVSDIAQS